MNKIIIIGGGINGLVAANYLIKSGFDVSIIEKKSQTGGACIKDTVEIQNKFCIWCYCTWNDARFYF